MAKLEIKLDEKEVIEIIKNCLIKKGYSVEEVTTIIEERYSGYGMHENKIAVFAGFKCKIEMEL